MSRSWTGRQRLACVAGARRGDWGEKGRKCLQRNPHIPRVLRPDSGRKIPIA